HLRERIAGHAGHDVATQAGAQAVLQQLSRRGHAVSHRHLDHRGDRGGAAGFSDELELPVAQVVAVDVGRVRAEEVEIVELLDHLEAPGHWSHPDVHADGHAYVPGQVPVVFDDLGHAEPRTPRAHGEGHEPAVGGEI